MQKKAVRVALEAVAAVIIFHFAQATTGVLSEIFVVLGIAVLVYAIVDLLR